MTDEQASDQSQSALESTYLALRQLILRGEFAPGERLTGQRLSALLGVSRTPIRSALIRLQSDGLVEIERGQSARIRLISASEVEQAYDIGGGLEGVLVYRLASTATTSQLQEIESLVNRLEQSAASGDKAGWVTADEEFHALLAGYGNNALLAQMMERVETTIGQLRYLIQHAGNESAQASAREHRGVFDAISAHNGELARRLHQAHWERVREVNTRFLREGLSGMRGFIG